MSIRILIVDDEAPARAKLRAFLEKEEDVEIVGEAPDGDSALAAIQVERPDLVFLDVQMPGLDGFGVVKALPLEKRPVVIFVTAHDRFALQAFEVHAVDYLLKPFDRGRFRQALDRARALVRHRRSGEANERMAALLAELSRPSAEAPLERVAVKSEGRIVLVKVDQIDWIEAADNYVQLHEGKAVHLHRETMSNLEKRLPGGRFVRISRSAIVNLERVRELQPMFHGEYVVVLRDGTKLTLTRSYRGNLEQLWRGESG